MNGQRQSPTNETNAISATPLSNLAMPENMEHVYYEARRIVSASSRGSAVLLRLAASVLAASDPRLGLRDKDDRADDEIKAMVAKGLPATVQKALDALRVIGNELPCIGAIDLREEPETASALLTLLKVFVQDAITPPVRTDAICVALPSPNPARIKSRDEKS
jgi:hypothetical protein